TYVYAAATTQNGAFVSTFGVAGVKKFNSGITDLYKASDILVDANGGILIAGLEWLDNLYVMKITATGAMDASWSNDGIAFIPTNNSDHWWDLYDMELDKNGQVLITGKKYRANNGSTIPAFWHVFVARWNANGTLDNTFATNGIGLYNSDPAHFDEAKSIMVTAANNYVTAGVTYLGSDYDYSATGILHNGAINPNFGVNGWSINDLLHGNKSENCLNAMMLPDGRILQTGNHGSGDTVHFALLMLNPDGSRDNVFAPDGLFMNIFNQNNNSSGQGMVIDSSGKIYMGGYTRTCVNGTCGPLSMAISRYNNTFGNTTAMEDGMLQHVTAYPNPVQAGGKFSLGGLTTEDVEALQLTDMTGKVVAVLNPGEDWRMPDVPHGVYLLKISTKNGTTTRKMVVQ
ncbi:MAG TPA: T9SS type A sorting domain-containing protein, partial [Bacteroidia bacterium]|nr:T9SS type A sorting domain-containing protein [Bacteroidia bacterium]